MGTMRLKTKLRLGFAVVLAPALIIFAFAYMRAVNDADANDWVEHSLTVLRDATECRATLDSLEARYLEFALSGSPAARSAYDDDLASLGSQLDALARLTADNPAQVQRWTSIKAQLNTLTANLSWTAAAPDQDRAQFAAVRDAFSLPIGVERQLLDGRTQVAEDQDLILERVIAVGAIAITLLSLVCAGVLSTNIGKPMERFARVADAIAQGNLDQRIDLKRIDEIGRAAKAFDAMADTVQRDLHESARMRAEIESVLNAAGEGIFGVDRHGKIAMMNTAASEITGYSIDEARGRSLHRLVHHTRADGSHYPAAECSAVAAMIEGRTLHVRGEVFWRKDGSSFPVDFTAVPILAEQDITGAVLTFHDITQQLSIDRIKDQIISVVSHEMKTPLTGIRASLRLLSSGMLGEVADQARRMLDIGVNNTERLVRLVDDIVDIEQLGSGKLAMQLRADNTRDLVVRSVDEMMPTANNADVPLSWDAESISVYVDSDRIVQALTNLIRNAIKFSDAGSPVQVQVARDAETARFCVRDRGPGIPPDRLESIFKGFEQAEFSNTKHKGGTGLGLSITRSIVRQHGGDVWVESELGKGSTFVFTIPVRA
jgi:PAS domain S-box-containing protein